MAPLFASVLDMSLTASIVIVAVILVRFCLRRAPKVISYALWSVVLFRLLCPVSLTAPVSVLEVTRPEVTVVSERTSSLSYLQEGPRETPVPQASRVAAKPVLPTASQSRRSSGAGWKDWAAWIWAAGAAGMLLHCLVSYLRLCRRLVGATWYRERIYLADHIPTPFVLGLWKPRIYLPSNTPQRERPYILAHEAHHIRRCDHIIKLLAYGALCVHWFNPLVWLAFFLAGKDMEMSCDEAVIKKLGPDIRAEYAQSLLRLATRQPIIAGVPLAFGEGDTKGRVKNMARWKQPKTWVVITSAVLCAAVLVSCAVNPRGKEGAASGPSVTETGTLPAEEPVTIGMSIPFDVMDVDAGGGETRFYLTEPIPGKISSQIIESELLGGIRVYEKPDIDLRDMGAWLRAVGVPQILSGEYDYIAESSSSAELEASFIDRNGLTTKHFYYIQADAVFELWFDPSRLDDMTRAAMKESVFFGPDAKISRSLPATQGTAAAAESAVLDANLEQCRSALEALREKDSYCLMIQRFNYGGPVLNDSSTTFHYRSGEDWMRITRVPDEGFDCGYAQFGYLFLDGVYYSNERSGWDEQEQILWEQVESVPDFHFWLEEFDWDAQEVRFISSLPAGKGQAVTLQVMAPLYDFGTDVSDSYQIQFVLNSNGQLKRLQQTVFLYSPLEGDYSYEDTIQITFGSAGQIIQSEYQRYLDQQ